MPFLAGVAQLTDIDPWVIVVVCCVLCGTTLISGALRVLRSDSPLMRALSPVLARLAERYLHRRQ